MGPELAAHDRPGCAAALPVDAVAAAVLAVGTARFALLPDPIRRPVPQNIPQRTKERSHTHHRSAAQACSRLIPHQYGTGIGAFITDNIIQPLALSQTSYPGADELPGGLRGYGWNPALGRFEDKTLFNPARPARPAR